MLSTAKIFAEIKLVGEAIRLRDKFKKGIWRPPLQVSIALAGW